MILLKQIEQYRAESETEAKNFIEKIGQEQHANGYKLTKSSSTYKNKKIKGEIVDEFYLVEITKSYDYE